MSYKFIYTRPKQHEEFSPVAQVVFEVDDERSVDEMMQAFKEFLRGCSYWIPEDFDDEC